MNAPRYETTNKSLYHSSIAAIQGVVLQCRDYCTDIKSAPWAQQAPQTPHKLMNVLISFVRSSSGGSDFCCGPILSTLFSAELSSSVHLRNWAILNEFSSVRRVNLQIKKKHKSQRFTIIACDPFFC